MLKSRRVVAFSLGVVHIRVDMDLQVQQTHASLNTPERKRLHLNNTG